MSAEHGPKVQRIIKNEEGVPGIEGPDGFKPLHFSPEEEEAERRILDEAMAEIRKKAPNEPVEMYYVVGKGRPQEWKDFYIEKERTLFGNLSQVDSLRGPEQRIGGREVVKKFLGLYRERSREDESDKTEIIVYLFPEVIKEKTA